MRARNLAERVVLDVRRMVRPRRSEPAPMSPRPPITAEHHGPDDGYTILASISPQPGSPVWLDQRAGHHVREAIAFDESEDLDRAILHANLALAYTALASAERVSRWHPS